MLTARKPMPVVWIDTECDAPLSATVNEPFTPPPVMARLILLPDACPLTLPPALNCRSSQSPLTLPPA